MNRRAIVRSRFGVKELGLWGRTRGWVFEVQDVRFGGFWSLWAGLEILRFRIWDRGLGCFFATTNQ